MFKFLIPVVCTAFPLVIGFAATAQADRWTCGMSITRGGCPMPVYLPETPEPAGK